MNMQESVFERKILKSNKTFLLPKALKTVSFKAEKVYETLSRHPPAPLLFLNQRATGRGGFQTGRGHEYYRAFLLKVGQY